MFPNRLVPTRLKRCYRDARLDLYRGFGGYCNGWLVGGVGGGLIYLAAVVIMMTVNLQWRFQRAKA